MSHPVIQSMIEAFETEADAAVNEVAPAYRARYQSIVEHCDACCATHLRPLDREYAALCRIMAATICQKGFPAVAGRSAPEGWAAAIVCTLGWVNFLSDPGFPPVLTQNELASAFGISASSMQAKSRTIRECLDLVQCHPAWTLPSLMDANPLIWMLELPSGVIIDIRSQSRHEQVAAFEAGVIPYIPADVAPVENQDQASADKV